MNYKLIIVKAIDEYKNQRTSYLSYFTQYTKNHIVDFADFFNGSKEAIFEYKKHIENQFDKELTKDNWALNAYNALLNDGKTVDQNGKPIQEHIDYIENKKKYLIEMGFIENPEYICCVRSDSGKIIENSFTDRLVTSDDDLRNPKYEIYELTYSDLVTIEKELLIAKENFIEKGKALSFRTYLSCSEEIKDKVISYIREEIKNSTKINVTMATITVALKKKEYLYYDNQSKYHESLTKEFGKIGQRTKFSERYGECNKFYQEEIQHYVNKLP